ncbi:MAG: CPBP family glutamic-type intramembrane protease [Pseudomonadota bacterium]
MILFRRPTWQDWVFTALCMLIFAAIAIPLGTMLGTLHWAPDLTSKETLRVALIALILPALLEEVVFRGPLIWWRERRDRVPLFMIILSLIAFIAWHPINALTFMPQAAETFLDWRFLLVAGLFGLAATVMTLRSRSLWPAIVCHWVMVVAWKGLFGAPGFL